MTEDLKLGPPDSKWLQPPQRPGLGTGFARLIVDYPGGCQRGMSGRSMDALNVSPLLMSRSFILA